jgi:hypothetical protein
MSILGSALLLVVPCGRVTEQVSKLEISLRLYKESPKQDSTPELVAEPVFHDVMCGRPHAFLCGKDLILVTGSVHEWELSFVPTRTRGGKVRLAMEATVPSGKPAADGHPCRRTLVLTPGKFAKLTFPNVGGKHTIHVEASARLLPGLADRHPRLVPGLLQALKLGDADVEKRILSALLTLRHDAVPGMCDALESNDKGLRLQAARVVGLVAAGGQVSVEEAVPLLLRLLKDEDAAVRRAAAQAVEAARGGLGEGAIPSLLDALQDDDAAVRRAAAASLALLTAGKQ